MKSAHKLFLLVWLSNESFTCYNCSYAVHRSSCSHSHFYTCIIISTTSISLSGFIFYHFFDDNYKHYSRKIYDVSQNQRLSIKNQNHNVCLLIGTKPSCFLWSVNSLYTFSPIPHSEKPEQVNCWAYSLFFNWRFAVLKLSFIFSQFNQPLSMYIYRYMHVCL